MAGILIRASQGAIASGTSLKTLVQIVAASNHRVKLRGWSISFDGATFSATPVLVQLMRQTTAGTMSALTGNFEDASVDESMQTTFQHTATAEPTASTVLETHRIHPNGGSFDVWYPYGSEVLIKGGTRLAIVITAAATVNCEVMVAVEE